MRNPQEGRAIARIGLLTILIVAALSRLYGLTTVPPPLNQDEVSPGYDAWCILETGADRHGQSWPFFRENFGPGDFTAALGAYLAIPTIACLGPTVAAVRLPCALLGIATVAIIFAVVRRWMGVPAAFVAAAILALDPWHVVMTRTAHEAAFAPFFLLAAIWCWQRGGLWPIFPDAAVEDSGGKRHVTSSFIGGVLFGLHTWVYTATRLFTPLFLIATVFVGWSHYRSMWGLRDRRRSLWSAFAGLIVGTLPLWWTAVAHPERLGARATATVLFLKPLPLAQMVGTFLTNLILNADPRYLFWKADDMSGAPFPAFGQHLLALAPVFAIGLILLAATCRRSAWSRWLFSWMILALVPAAICDDWNPHPFRAITGFAAFPIVCAYGALWLGQCLIRVTARRQKAVIAAASLAVVVNAAHFLLNYFIVFPPTAEPAYQTALWKALQAAGRHVDEADFILVTNRANQPYIYALWCQPIPPRDLPTVPTIIADDRLGFHQVLRLGKYYFAPRDPERSVEITARFHEAFGAIPPGARGLVVERAGHFKGGELLTTIDCGDGRQTDQNVEIRWWRPGEAGP